MRTTLAFIMLISIAHILGKQTISQMTFHDFIASIMIGGIAGNLAFNTTIDIKLFVIALTTFTALLIISTLLSLKNRNFRALLSGEPTVFIEKGKILEGNMKKLRYTMDSLNQGLREKGVFNIDEVEYAILEMDGHLSILKKPPYQHAVKKDLGISDPGTSAFPVELIMDGQIIDKNFWQNGLTKEWLNTELSKRGLVLKDVAYGVRGTNNQLYFDLFKDKIVSPLDIES